MIKLYIREHHAEQISERVLNCNLIGKGNTSHSAHIKPSRTGIVYEFVVIYTLLYMMYGNV